MNRYNILICSLVAAILIFGIGCACTVSGGGAPTPNPPYTPPKSAIHLEANLGQSDPQYKFLGRGDGYFLFLNESETVFDLGGRVLRLRLANARPGAPATTGDAFSRTNYLLGPDPSRWVTNIPTYNEVTYAGVYPGVDLVYYSRDGKLEHDFRLAPGADPAQIAWSLEGVDRVTPDGDSLILHAGARQLRWHAPVAYQGSRQIPIKYRLHNGAISFEVAPYDKAKPLVIDPVISYLTYLGRRGGEAAGRSTIDAQGNVYITGATSDAEYPTTPGALTPNPLGFTQSNVIITKFDASGTRPIFSTYFGGLGSEYAAGVALDANGNIYITGATDSADFPTTAGAFQTRPATMPTNTKDQANCFVAKLNPAGTALLYSTFLSGTGEDGCTAIAVDKSGNAIVTGGSDSTNFPTTADVVQGRYRLGQGDPSFDIIVAKFNPLGLR